MQSVFPLLGSVLMIFIIIAAPNLVHPLTPENHIAITLDKKIYSLGEEVMATVTNLSDNTITFATWECDLVLERWTGNTWERISWYHKHMLRNLGPHENVVVTLRGGLIDQLGEYRVGTWGVWTEFEVQGPGSAWIVPSLAVVTIIGIAVTYLIKKRTRG